MNNHQRKLNYEGIKVPAEGRVLIIVPILHTKEDMGSIGNRLSMTDGYTDMVSDFWREVKEKVKQYINGFVGVKIYQDGLPDTQKKFVGKIISEVQSPNYELLRFLKEKGAKVLGTEDQELLKKEYKFITQILRAQDEMKKNKQSLILAKARNKRACFSQARNKLKQAYEGQAGELLVKRDTYIANRIDKTLNRGELGILFVGAAHAIEEKLPADIQVEIL